MLKSTIIRGLAGLAAITVLGVAAACAPASATTDEPVTAGPTESAAPLDPAPSEETTEEAPVEEPSEEAPEDEDYAFGDTVTYDDGLQVTVGKPRNYKPSEYSSYDKKADSYVSFEVTVKNGTDKRFDPTMFTTTASSGDKEMEEIFDSSKGLEGSPDTKVLKGHTVKFKIGYGVMEGQPLVLEVSPDFDHDNTLYVS